MSVRVRSTLYQAFPDSPVHPGRGMIPPSSGRLFVSGPETLIAAMRVGDVYEKKLTEGRDDKDDDNCCWMD